MIGSEKNVQTAPAATHDRAVFELTLGADIIWIKPPDHRGTGYGLHFDKTAIEPLFHAVGESEWIAWYKRNQYRNLRIALNTKQALWLERECKRLLTQMHAPEPDFSLIWLRLGCVLIRLGRMAQRQEQFRRQPKRDERIRHLISYLDRHFDRRIRLDELAKMSGISKYYLSHKFKAETGLTIIEYVNMRKVNRSKKLLLYTDQPIIDVCFASGFQSVQHFGRVFKKMTSMTPCQYREKYGAGLPPHASVKEVRPDLRLFNAFNL